MTSVFLMSWLQPAYSEVIRAFLLILVAYCCWKQVHEGRVRWLENQNIELKETKTVHRVEVNCRVGDESKIMISVALSNDFICNCSILRLKTCNKGSYRLSIFRLIMTDLTVA